MSKNSTTLAAFTNYCRQHPAERFWQALRNWSENQYILAKNVNADGVEDIEDTFYWE